MSVSYFLCCIPRFTSKHIADYHDTGQTEQSEMLSLVNINLASMSLDSALTCTGTDQPNNDSMGLKL